MMKRLNRKEWKASSVSAKVFFGVIGATLGTLIVFAI